MKKNAIILAAGKSNRFAPFTYEKPKGLFLVRGEVLLERQIQQLQSAGINEIYIVVGYMKEKFFYLEKKYDVKLIINNEFAKKGNLYSLYVARKYLSNTYICCADHYFTVNPFIDTNDNNISYRSCSYQKGKFREFAIKVSDADVITQVNVGGQDSLAMVGSAYFNEKFSRIFVELMEREIFDFGVDSMFWEEFFAKHKNELTLYMKKFQPESIWEFDDIEDLCSFDADFFMNIDSDIISNICKAIHCVPNDIGDIHIVSAGLTNMSFSFRVQNEYYIYRHPGGTAGNLVSRNSEKIVQEKAKLLGLDNSFVMMDQEGWKVSHFIKNAQNCDFEKNNQQLQTAMEYLHILHKIPADENIRRFDNVSEGKKLMKIASATKGNLCKEFSDVVKKVERLYQYIEEDAKKLGYGLVMCHNDVYEPNFLSGDNDKVYLIDWEYAGRNYAANDIGGILCRYDWTDEQVSRYLKFYFGRDLTGEEQRFYMAFIPISAFYWFCWGLYKGSVGDDDSFFFLPAYRNLIRYIDSAIESYEEHSCNSLKAPIE
ncbi:NTP transferase domain-containing protein [Kineothrix sp. MSJ-39]|uniref:NTP transferase domain-containing protein n=1 Tax=Kineothrix sp. MSJ-39 TaxID=2841533 RepID=UPI001C10E4E4|nr:NTP transferase domain-containing protein [Kineothrix sp. MSJ-39]MBU5430986.1 NTP transferase domain-containing protein [Kineothrix sp. MSJ-39]